MRIPDLRSWLDRLQSRQLLAIANPGIALTHDLAAVLEHFMGRKAVLFPSPDGHAMPVVGGIVADRSWIADAMGIAPDTVLPAFSRAVAGALPWREVSAAEAPVQQVVHRGPDLDVMALLPVPVHSERDGGPFITGGLVGGCNPDTGRQNLSINRIQVFGRDKLGILMLPRDLHAYYQAAEARDAPLPITITIGHDPLTELASQAVAPRDLCELEIAGALQGAPLPVVKSLTNEVRVPANAEIAIEGLVLPHRRALEGPLGEFTRYYQYQELRPYVTVTAVTHRKRPIYRTIIPYGREPSFLGGVPREATLLQRLQVGFPNVSDLRLTLGSLCRFHVVIRMRKDQAGQAKQALLAVFGLHYDIKHAVAVDEDIDIHDDQAVDWAIATRFRADRDLLTVAGVQGSRLDPSSDPDGRNAKMGIDATVPLGEAGKYYVAFEPGLRSIDAARILQEPTAAVLAGILD
ncbi:MAG: UbiD family decarboxylase [Sneathiellaceae bacterium]